ncbi:TPM domain-containing protein [Selenomonas massiliensis]|uniref:TPM domain-containing protein n=1 Tax=Selenomonas massiliensis TaxID=2058293 RepID=UPI000D102864|nr:TPM domain-containing protein [Selenomonas massiliensis]
MMNKTTNGRSALLALLLLCLSILLAVPKAADASGTGNARVIDEMNLLSDAEVQKLDAQLAAVERTHRIRILAAIVGDWKDKPLKPLAENIIKTIAPGGEHGAVLLLLSPENNTYYVATDAKLRTRITDEGIEHLTEKFLPAFESKKYADMFTAFGQVAGEMLTYYEKEGKPFTTGGALSAVARAVAAGGTQTGDAGLGALRVIDESDLITDAEEQALDAKLAAYEAAHGIRILIGTVKNTHKQVLGKVANGVVDRIADGGANGTIVLLLAPKDRDFYISTDNKMRTRITDDDGIEHLAGQFVPSLKENKYAEGFTAFAATVDEMVTYYEKEGKPFNPDAFLLTIVTLVGALIPAAIVYWFVFANLSDSMLSVRGAHEADDYVERGSFRLTHKEDVFLRTTEARRTKYKETSSSSSSSGSYISTSSRDESHGGGGGKY